MQGYIREDWLQQNSHCFFFFVAPEVSLEVSPHTKRHDIQAAHCVRYKQIKLHERRLVRDFLPALSKFVPGETDSCVHLEDIIMARVPTVGDRRVTGVCAWRPTTRLPLSLISTSLPSGRLTALTGPIMKLFNVGLFRRARTQTHTQARARARRQICRNMLRNTCTEQAQPQGKCHSYTQAKQWSLQGDMNLKDQLCAEP